MVIQEDELKRNEHGEIVGYEGEWKTAAAGFGFGLILSFVIFTGMMFDSGNTVIQKDAHLPQENLAVQYCYYENSTGIYPVSLNILKGQDPMNSASDSTKWVLEHEYSQNIHQHPTWTPEEWNCNWYGYDTYHEEWRIGGENQ